MKGIKYLFCSALVLIGGLALSIGHAAAADELPIGQSVSTAPLDEVLVTGEQPGPGLWKISKGDHVMWVLGAHSPLPKKMTWRSKEVEETVARSQVFLFGPAAHVHAEVGFFRKLTLMPSLVGLRNNPNDAQLKDILSPELYSHWLVLKGKYIGSSNATEKWRPIFAAQELYNQAIAKVGLEQFGSFGSELEKIAKKTKIKTVNPMIDVPLEKPGAAIKEFKKSSLDDVECFAKTIERLETDLDLMRARANAWARGDVAAIREMTHVDQATACIAAVMNAQFAQERGWQDIPARAANAWLTAAEEQLANNSSTFAVLSIDEIFKVDGVVAKLRERGYKVDEPL